VSLIEKIEFCMEKTSQISKNHENSTQSFIKNSRGNQTATCCMFPKENKKKVRVLVLENAIL
jgi:hypothetical protein